MTPSATSANMMPSAYMPAPPNMRCTSTGPNTENNSRISLGDTEAPQARRRSSVRVRLGCRLELDRFTPAASRCLVGIVEHELRRELVGLVVHLGAEQEQHRLGIDQDPDALVLDHLVRLFDSLGIFHRIGHAGAAAILDADAYAHHRLHRI